MEPNSTPANIKKPAVAANITPIITAKIQPIVMLIIANSKRFREIFCNENNRKNKAV